MTRTLFLAIPRKLGIWFLVFSVLSAVLPLQVVAAEISGPQETVSPPDNVSVVSGVGSLTVIWDAGSGAVSYNVYYKEAGDAYSDPISTGDTHLVIDGLDYGQEYLIQISSIGEDSDESEKSDPISATPEAPNPPSAPIIDQAVAGDSSIAVTWQLLTDSSVAGYFINYKELGHADYTKVDVGLTGSFVLTGLVNGTTYDVAVSAYDDSLTPYEGELSNVLSATPQPGAVMAAEATLVNLKSVDPGDGKVNMTWDALVGASSYQVRIATGNAGAIDTATPIDMGLNTTYMATGLTNGTEYFFAVEKTGDTGTRSTILNTTPQALEATITTPAATPFTLATDKLTVSGTTSVPGTVAVYAENKTDATDIIPPVSKSFTGTSWTVDISGLKNGAEYDVWAVLTKFADPTSPESNHVSVVVDRSVPTLTISWPVFDSASKFYTKESSVVITGICDVTDLKLDGSAVTLTGGAFSFSVTPSINAETAYTFIATGTNGNKTTKIVHITQDSIAPPQISKLTYEVGNQEIKLLWNDYAAPEDIRGYNIYYGTNKDSLSKANTEIKSEKSFTIRSLKNGEMNYFAVSAVDMTGNESIRTNTLLLASSEDVAPKAPAKPVLSVLEGKLKVTWTAVSGAGGYKVYYGTAPNSYGTPIDVGNMTSYDISGLKNGTPYYVAVSAYDSTTSKREGPKSEEASATPVSSTSSLGLTISVDKANANLGDTLTYTIEYKNTGTSTLTGVNLKAILPSNLSYIANSASGSPSVQDSDKTLVWGIGSLNSGAVATVTFKGTVNSSVSGTILTKTELTSDQTGSTIKTANVSTTLGLVAANTVATTNAASTDDPPAGTDPNSVNDPLPSTLPYTGLELRWYFLLAMVLMAAGALLFAGRKRGPEMMPVKVEVIKKRYLWTSRR